MTFPNLWAVFDSQDRLCSDALHEEQRAYQLLPLVANAHPAGGPYHVAQVQISLCSQTNLHSPSALLALNTRETKDELIKRLIQEGHGRKADVSIAKALEFRREAYELSMEEFSLILQIRESHYCEMVHGKRELPKKGMQRAYAIGVPAYVLLQGKG